MWRKKAKTTTTKSSVVRDNISLLSLLSTFLLYCLPGCCCLPPLQGKQGVHGAYALVHGGSSTLNHFITEIARCGEFWHEFGVVWGNKPAPSSWHMCCGFLHCKKMPPWAQSTCTNSAYWRETVSYLPVWLLQRCFTDLHKQPLATKGILSRSGMALLWLVINHR